MLGRNSYLETTSRFIQIAYSYTIFNHRKFRQIFILTLYPSLPFIIDLVPENHS